MTGILDLLLMANVIQNDTDDDDENEEDDNYGMECDEDYEETSSALTDEPMDELADIDVGDLELHERVLNHNNNNNEDHLRFISYKTPSQYKLEKLLQIPESLFRRCFLLQRKTALHLLHRMLGTEHLRCLSVEEHARALYNLLVGFHYFCTGEYLLRTPPELAQNVGFEQLELPLPRTLVKLIIIKVAQLLYQQKRQLCFPRSKKKQRKLAADFEARFGIKHTMGCIDCVQVSIVDDFEEAHKYMNPHQYTSLNVEAICDANLIFTSVRVYRGSKRDGECFTESPLCNELRSALLSTSSSSPPSLSSTTMSSTPSTSSKQCVNWLLGDGAYSLEPFLLTPYMPAQRDCELVFNEMHAQVCDGSIRRALELLRTRFKCLLKHRPIDFSPMDASFIVRGCFVLFNVLLQQPGEIDHDMVVFELDDVETCYGPTDRLRDCAVGLQTRNDYASTLTRKKSS